MMQIFLGVGGVGSGVLIFLLISDRLGDGDDIIPVTSSSMMILDGDAVNFSGVLRSGSESESII